MHQPAPGLGTGGGINLEKIKTVLLEDVSLGLRIKPRELVDQEGASGACFCGHRCQLMSGSPPGVA